MINNTEEGVNHIAQGRTGMVMEFVERGNSPHATDSNGVSIMQWCAYYGDVNAIRYLVSKGASLDTLGKNYDLNGAAFHGMHHLCEYLLQQGADANYADPMTSETPLHLVLSKSDRPVNAAIVKLLLQAKADPNARTNPGVETGAFMRDVRTRYETPLHRAAAFGDEETIRLLLDAGADKRLKDMHGDSPLSWASWYLRPRPILALLCYGDFRVNY